MERQSVKAIVSKSTRSPRSETNSENQQENSEENELKTNNDLSVPDPHRVRRNRHHGVPQRDRLSANMSVYL